MMNALGAGGYREINGCGGTGDTNLVVGRKGNAVANVVARASKIARKAQHQLAESPGAGLLPMRPAGRYGRFRGGLHPWRGAALFLLFWRRGAPHLVRD